MNWVFVFVALSSNGAIVEKVNMESASQCVAYASSYISRSELTSYQVEVAKCVELRSGQFVNIPQRKAPAPRIIL